MKCRYAHGICDACDDPVALGPTGWYRCRSCGHESLRQFDPSSSAPAFERGGEAAALGLSLTTSSDMGGDR